MTTAVDPVLAASRPLGVARELGAEPVGSAAVFSKLVVLTGEPQVLATRNGRWCFMNSLRLLARVVGELQVALPPDATQLQAEIDQLLPSLWSQGDVRRVQQNECQWARASAILNIGTSVQPELPWTSVIANGWVARCTSAGSPLPVGSEQDNPISSMLAASLGVTDVFKRVYSIPHDRAPLMENAAFSLFELSSRFDGIGPALPDRISLPSTLLLGGGAIGNGLVLLGSQLSLAGRMLILDKQDFGDENYGTCALLDSEKWLGEPKAVKLAEWLGARSDLDVKGLKTTIEEASDKGLLDANIDLVINGLDEIDPRRAVQKLWARLTVDGAINSAGAAVVTYSLAHRDQACLRCAFDLSTKDHIVEQSKLTGLTRKSLEGDQNRLITDVDIETAAEEMKPFLREQQRLGRRVCSTMHAAQAAGLGIKLDAGFQPSVPFVATAAAALVWAQVLRSLLWPDERFVHRVQLDSLFLGPHVSHRLQRPASAECECTRHAALIDRILASRSAGTSVS